MVCFAGAFGPFGKRGVLIKQVIAECCESREETRRLRNGIGAEKVFLFIILETLNHAYSVPGFAVLWDFLFEA